MANEGTGNAMRVARRLSKDWDKRDELHRRLALAKGEEHVPQYIPGKEINNRVSGPKYIPDEISKNKPLVPMIGEEIEAKKLLGAAKNTGILPDPDNLMKTMPPSVLAAQQSIGSSIQSPITFQEKKSGPDWWQLGTLLAPAALDYLSTGGKYLPQAAEAGKKGLESYKKDLKTDAELQAKTMEKYVKQLEQQAKNKKDARDFGVELGKWHSGLASTKANQAVSDAYDKIRNIVQGVEKGETAPGVSDVSLVYSFMKMLDDISVVRPGEIELLKQASPWIEDMKVVANRLLGGEGTLVPEQRAAMLKVADTLYKSSAEDEARVRSQFVRMATEAGIDNPEGAFLNFQRTFEPLPEGYGSKLNKKEVKKGPPSALRKGLSLMKLTKSKKSQEEIDKRLKEIDAKLKR